MSYLPHFISWIVVSTLVIRFLDQDTGLVNNLLSTIGHERVGFMRDPKYFWTIVISVSNWKELGWNSIIYLAALTSVDQELYEAAMVDGAGRFKKLIYITLPSIAPTIGLLLVLNVGALISSGGFFDAVYNLQNPLVAKSAYTLELYAYYKGIAYSRYAYATAITLAQSLIALLMVFGANKVFKKLSGLSAF